MSNDVLFQKDPAAVLDFQWDWTAWLAADEAIASFLVTPDLGLSVDSSTEDGAKVTAWVSGGTVGSYSSVRCRITTSAGRTDVRSIRIRIANR